MKVRTLLLLLFSHSGIAFIGFAAGIYVLPILTAPSSPEESELIEKALSATYHGNFEKNLADSDALHWGEGTVSVSKKFISLKGKLAPGPDYKLYLSPRFIETEADFKHLKSRMVQVGDVKTFENFIVAVPADIDPNQYNSVIIWCESFEQFISAAQYKAPNQ